MAKKLGAKVIALVGTPSKAEQLRRHIDVDLVIATDGNDNWPQQILDFTNGRGLDVVLDNTGVVNKALKAIADFGRIVLLGFVAREGVMEDVAMHKLLLKSLQVTGYDYWKSGKRDPQELQRIWDGYVDMIRCGLRPVLSGRYEGLEDISRAMRDLKDRNVVGKIVVKIADEKETAKL